MKGQKRTTPPQDEIESPRKKAKVVDRYPPMDVSRITDDATFKRYMSTLNTELDKPKPKKEIILELMRNTFSHRREFILDEASNVAEILEKYPALRLPDVVGWTLIYIHSCTLI